MARIAGVDIPGNKQAWVSLQYLYGVGKTLSRQILDQAGIPHEVKINSLTEGEINKLREVIDKQYRVEGELRKEVTMNVKRLLEIGSYRGTRHRYSLPARGQRTRTNARTKRGVRKTVAGRGQRRGMSKK